MQLKYKTIYIAGPLHTPGERWYLEKVDNMCKALGFQTFLPHNDAGLCPPSGERSKFFFEKDCKNLNKTDLLIAVLNGPDIDSGTAWEIGFSFARGCKIIGLYEDTRIYDPKSDTNLMIYNSADVICDSLKNLKETLLLLAKQN